MAVLVAPELHPFADWRTWRAFEAGVGIFELVETPEGICGYCWGGRRVVYGRLALPCPRCWGEGTIPARVVVRLVERRAVARS